MKSKILIAGLICVVAIPPAFAVTKCVKLTSSTKCSGGDVEYLKPNWSANCDGMTIQGVAFCGSQDGGSQGATTDNVITSLNLDDNKYCWCKMISPAVSRWVSRHTYGSDGPCASICAGSCASSALSNASFRSALFSNLSD